MPWNVWTYIRAWDFLSLSFTHTSRVSVIRVFCCTFTGTFAKWPDSEYFLLGNNSNVFARYLIVNSGLTLQKLHGLHPPGKRSKPRKPNPNRYGTAKPVKK